MAWDKRTGSSGGAGSFVKQSAINGNLTVDENEIKVYTHPTKHTINEIDGLEDALNSKTSAAHSHKLSDITDLDTTNKTEGYALIYDAANSKYISKPLPTGTGSGATNLDGLSDVDVTTTAPIEGNSLIYSEGIWKPKTASNNSTSFETELLGELFFPSGIKYYNSWTPTNLKYDKNKGRWVFFANGADKHIYTEMWHYFVEINPDTFEIESEKEVTAIDANGDPMAYPQKGAVTAFIVLDDGSYMYIRRSENTYTYNRVVSIDGGVTWVDKGTISVTPAFTSAYTIWGLAKVSHGRIIAGLGGHSNSKSKIMVSDDNGVTWRVITIGVDASVTTGNGQQAITAAEPAIIEVSTNRLISIARKATSGTTYPDVGSAPDPALIAFSYDNGETWGAGYKDSQSITKMNSASAAVCMHDNTIEVFTASRFWYTSDNVETGKAGAVYHYTANVQDAFNDKFTLKKRIAFAHTDDSTDIHAPFCDIDENNRLLMGYFDGSTHFAYDTNYWFARGNVGYVQNPNLDKEQSQVFGYSSKYIEKLLSKLNTEIATLKNALAQTNTNIPIPIGTMLWTKQYTANTKVKLFNDVNFSALTKFSNTSDGYNVIATNSNGISYHDTGTTWATGFTTTKPNFSIEYKGTFGNQLGAVIGAIINGIGYGLITVADYKINDAGTFAHSYRFEYNNGKMKAFIDEYEVSVKTFSTSEINSGVYTNFTSIIGILDNTKNYLIGGCGSGADIYELKIGEWT